MGRRLVLLGFVALLAGTVVASTATARSVEGVLQADVPATVDGRLDTQPTRGTLWVTNEDGGQLIRPMILHADRVQVTYKVLETTTAKVGNLSVESPEYETHTDTYTVDNATIVVSALGRHTDILFAPLENQTYVAQGAGSGTGLVDTDLDGIEVLDGYRERHEFDDDEEFAYRYELDERLVAFEDSPTVQLNGAAHGYVWDAYVMVRNATETVESYETGAHVESSNQGATRAERYEYVTFQFEELNATLHPRGVRDRLLAPEMNLDVDGSIALRQPAGSLSTKDGEYQTDGVQSLTVDGNVSLDLSPIGNPDVPRLSVGVDGDVSSVTAPLLGDGDDLVSTQNVVAGASGATLLGLAAWYLASAKGASMAIPLVAGRKSEEDEPAAVADASEPSELLFDPDRFALYHLIRSRIGLSAKEARELTGIDATEEQLDLLVDHGLLSLLSEDPRRYCIPGSAEGETAERIAFLRQPVANRAAELLAVHGLIPEEQLVERVRRTEGDAAARRVPDLVQTLVDLGLAYREAGEEGFVVDPTDRLFDCFERMGAGAIPKVS